MKSSKPESRVRPSRISFAAVIMSGAAIIGLAVAAFFVQHFGNPRVENSEQPVESHPALSSSTMSVLEELESPVEIRFYALLDPASVPERTLSFARRASVFLAEYERASAGRVKVVRFESMSDAAAASAFADGVSSFNRAEGDACYFGVTVLNDQRRETIGRLSEEWEQALEFDLSRMIARVSAPSPEISAAAANTSAAELESAMESLRSDPAGKSATLEEGTQKLRETALLEFGAAVKEMEERLRKAEADRAGADELLRIRFEQTEKIKDITARLQHRIAALEKMHSTGR